MRSKNGTFHINVLRDHAPLFAKQSGDILVQIETEFKDKNQIAIAAIIFDDMTVITMHRRWAIDQFQELTEFVEQCMRNHSRICYEFIGSDRDFPNFFTNKEIV